MSVYSSQTTLGGLKSTINFSEYSWPFSGGVFSLDDFSLEEITVSIKEITLSNLNIQLENEIYLNYLTRAEPHLLLSLQEDMEEQEKADKRGKRMHSLLGLTGGGGSTTLSTHWKSKVDERLSMNTPTVSYVRFRGASARGKEDTGRLSIFNPSATSSIHSFALNTSSGLTSNMSSPKVNFNKKFELVIRAIDERRDAITDRNKRYLVTRSNVHTNRQQLEMALKDTRNAHADFQNYVVSASSENIAHRIPAEKFVVFMEKWFKKIEKEICNLGLKVQKYKVLYVEKRLILHQRSELFENLRPVDIHLVRKEITDDEAKLEAKMASIMELKTMFMPLERNALIFKEHIHAQEQELKKIEDLKKKREFSITEMERHIGKTQTEVKNVRERLNALREQRSKYEGVDVMGYLHVKLEVARLKKELKAWKRRNTVQHMNLKANTRLATRIKRQNMYLTGLCSMSTVIN